MGTFTPQPLGRKDASGQIARQLRAAISSGVWSPGERLPSEGELAEAFDVARATAREGLKLLSATGLVVSSRGSNGGTFVSVPDSEEVAEQLADAIQLWYRAGNVSVRDVDEARWVLEMHCVELAALRRDDTDLAAIREPVEAGKDLSLSMPDWLDLDLTFHTAITRAARNRILELAMTSVHLARPATNSVFVDQLDRERVTRQHEDIYLAIAASDPDGARAAFQRHVEYLDETRRAALKETSPDTVLVSTLPPMRHHRD
ncbi:FadR/GntR family transcriptional regulator [Microbacterium sp. ABRD28]|uniref:FadR/GntR family transcriptional regulator n=1 Tax=Microbacterium sp. ABRD28 TaxID=2268461 RepID=UPI000F54F02C|nr:FadR/GntR family transcriptional regulator [Microbacterium sp. ABRD28]AZC13227.1 FadR family transcriptional regulator [Microbacterium sp. ABRD28]